MRHALGVTSGSNSFSRNVPPRYEINIPEESAVIRKSLIFMSQKELVVVQK